MERVSIRPALILLVPLILIVFHAGCGSSESPALTKEDATLTKDSQREIHQALKAAQKGASKQRTGSKVTGGKGLKR
jgi:hypothetical protein